MNKEAIDRHAIQLEDDLKSKLQVVASANLEIIACSSRSLLSINECIANLKDVTEKGASIIDYSLTWTTKKSYLVELIYALQEVGAFNNGTAGVKQIASLFERLFNVTLGNSYYRDCIEIRKRKNCKTIFIEMMKERLAKRFGELDGNAPLK